MVELGQNDYQNKQHCDVVLGYHFKHLALLVNNNTKTLVQHCDILSIFANL